MANEPTIKVRNVSPLGEVENWLARRVFAPGEVVELPAEVAGHEPFVRDLEDGEVPVAGHSIEIDGVLRYADPGSGLLAQVEHFERVVENAPKVKHAPAPTADLT